MEISYSTINFTYDETAPLSGVSIPSDGLQTNYLAQIEGTSFDETAGVEKVELYIHDVTNGQYWTSALEFVSTTTIQWVTADNVTWQYTDINHDTHWKLNGDAEYRIRCRAYDNAGNLGPVGSTHTFTYDVTSPVSEITNPPDEEPPKRLNALASIDGTASDCGRFPVVPPFPVRASLRQARTGTGCW